MLIVLENMEFYARHGCFELERRVGMRFSVDVEIETPDTGAAAADDIEGTVNYLDVYQIVREQMEIPSKIIENVAYRIVEAIRIRLPKSEKITVKVSKIAPSLGGKVGRASVVLSR